MKRNSAEDDKRPTGDPQPRTLTLVHTRALFALNTDDSRIAAVRKIPVLAVTFLRDVFTHGIDGIDLVSAKALIPHMHEETTADSTALLDGHIGQGLSIAQLVDASGLNDRTVMNRMESLLKVFGLLLAAETGRNIFAEYPDLTLKTRRRRVRREVKTPSWPTGSDSKEIYRRVQAFKATHTTPHRYPTPPLPAALPVPENPENGKEVKRSLTYEDLDTSDVLTAQEARRALNVLLIDSPERTQLVKRFFPGIIKWMGVLENAKEQVSRSLEIITALGHLLDCFPWDSSQPLQHMSQDALRNEEARSFEHAREILLEGKSNVFAVDITDSRAIRAAVMIQNWLRNGLGPGEPEPPSIREEPALEDMPTPEEYEQGEKGENKTT